MAQKNVTLNLQEICEALQKQFYVDVSFPVERSVIENAIQAFFKFLEEPDPVKAYIDFSIAPQHRRGDVGFKQREPTKHIYNDSKEFFHFHPALFEHYADFLEKHPVVYDFTLKAQPIWDLTHQVVGDILRTFEPKFPGICAKIFDAKHPHILLRFLRYDWQVSGQYLAKPHFDAGSFTLAIAESCLGLRIGSRPENLQIVQHKDKHAIFMLASNFRKVMNTHELSAGWHDVLQVDETFIGKPFSRWAVVAFIEAHGVEALPRTETHKWHTAVA